MDTTTKALKIRQIKAVPAESLLPDSKKPAIQDGGLSDILNRRRYYGADVVVVAGANTVGAARSPL